MLTIEPNIEHPRQKYARIAISGLSYEDQLRLRSLAMLCFGHHVLKPDSYIFTEVRGRKCWLLFQAGFKAIDGFTKSAHKTPLKHPDHRKSFALHEAVVVAEIILKGRAA